MESETTKSLINVGELAKPANTLVKRIADAFGIIYAPTHLKRMAKAEVEADKIRALGRIDVSEIEERGLRRLVKEQGRSQENLESITAQALQGIQPEAKPEQIEDDWLAHFFEECKHVSNPEMQSVWAKLLAGEANKSGTFSVRTIKLLATMDKSEAKLFTQLCGFAWSFSDVSPLIFDMGDKIYAEEGINFTTLCDLASLGLITIESMGIGKLGVNQQVLTYYFGDFVMLDSDAKPFDIPIGHVALTRSGRELSSICGAKPKDGFIEYVVTKWGVPSWPAKPIRAFSQWPRLTGGDAPPASINDSL